MQMTVTAEMPGHSSGGGICVHLGIEAHVHDDEVDPGVLGEGIIPRNPVLTGMFESRCKMSMNVRPDWVDQFINLALSFM